MGDAAAPYARPVIFLFLGGFMLGLAMERWGLHKRIALLTILAVGAGPRSIIAGFLLATAVLSAFVSNTATVIMLIPIATSVLSTLPDNPDAPEGARKRFATCLVLAAVALFVTPVNRKWTTFALNWDKAREAPFGILLLFGGGLSLAAAVTATGLDAAIGQQFARLQGVPIWLIVLGLCLTVTFLTELTSNTAVTSALLPVLAAAGPVLGIDDAYLLLPATVSASCAFMLPVATPPNAVAFSSGHVSIMQMARTGILLNLVCAGVVTAWVMIVAPRLLT